ncbi:hypothetical protein [Nitrosomonas sp. Is37]|uniref:hypothetical protein n=1 Tax=Nitrosomonas sp. Is37 TaxID=3080535 RepID=UPI00294ADF33|nr:hypothetical protein [Nitrosomonas sp. Is37]MDV6345720.1 hypothetical protein [Nitrosomonas sp. Is37]
MNIAQDIELHRLGYGERSLMFLLPNILPTKGDEVSIDSVNPAIFARNSSKLLVVAASSRTGAISGEFGEG